MSDRAHARSDTMGMVGIERARRARRATAVVLVALSIGCAAAPQAVAETSDTSTRRTAMMRLLDARIQDSRIGSNFAMIVTDADTGQVVWSQDPDNQQRAASNMKIVTAVNSLATMSPDKRFVTKVLSGWTPGDVIIQGGGDPLLSRCQVQGLADRTARAFKRGARVTVHVDGDLFAPPAKGPGWTPGYDNYLIASVQALAMYGDRTRTPSLNAARLFASRLRSHGINAQVGRNADATPVSRLLARTAGHTVSQSVGVMLSRSESNVSEVLFRQVAIASGMPATWTGGIEAAKKSLAALGVDASNVRILDGSGLSRRDRLTPRFLADLLRTVRVLQGPRFKAMFLPSAMPIAGRTGTLNAPYGRYDTSPSRCAAGRVQAKTGTLYDVIALSGIAKAVDGRRLIFSMIVNSRPTGYSKLTTRRALDGLAATITGCWR